MWWKNPGNNVAYNDVQAALMININYAVAIHTNLIISFSEEEPHVK